MSDEGMSKATAKEHLDRLDRAMRHYFEAMRAANKELRKPLTANHSAPVVDE